MKRKTLNLVLALSLLLNVFVLIGYARYLVGDEPAMAAEEVVDRTAQMLGLDAKQTADFKRLRESMAEEAAAFDGEIVLARQELDEEMRRDAPDRERLDEINAKLADLYHQRRIAGAERFGEFVAKLTPEQRRRMSERMHRGRRGEGSRRGGFMQRFDRNRDGKVDEQERAEARKAMERDRGERGRRDGRGRRGHGSQMKGQIYERFDANDDGRLDDAELAEVMKWLAEPPRRRGEPSGPPLHPEPPREPDRGPAPEREQPPPSGAV